MCPVNLHPVKTAFLSPQGSVHKSLNYSGDFPGAQLPDRNRIGRVRNGAGSHGRLTGGAFPLHSSSVMQLGKNLSPIPVNPLRQPGKRRDEAIIVDPRLHRIGQPLLTDTQKLRDQKSKSTQGPFPVIVQRLFREMVLPVRIVTVHSRHHQPVF